MEAAKDDRWWKMERLLSDGADVDYCNDVS